jgi:carbamoyltransferase
MANSEDIIGVHYGHDATVVLLRGGVMIEAMSEERLSRLKKHIGFPSLALQYLRKKYALKDIQHVYVVGEQHSPIILWDKERYREERKKREEKTDWFLRGIRERFFFGRMVSDAIRKLRESSGSRNDAKDIVHKKLSKEFPNASITFINHHAAHVWAAVPFFPNFKERRLVVTLDGEGDGLSGVIAEYENGHVKILHRFPNSASLGLLYSSVVDVLGMARNEHEFKVMGLAPYAKPAAGEKAYSVFRELLSFDGARMRFMSKMDMRHATAHLVAQNINTAHRFDSLAYGIQKLTEEITEDIVRAAIARYGIADIAVGGGVFMNVKANQHIAAMPEVSSLVVTPSCGDESLAVGAAVFGYSELHGGELDALSPIADLYLGSAYDDTEIKAVLDANEFTKTCAIAYFDPNGTQSIERRIAELLAKNEVVGRFKGRAEWGARALGNRSILANPSSRETVKLINEMIKGRDFWMPFATSMLEEEQDIYLVNPRGIKAPYMAITFDTLPRAHAELAAALHPYDYTSRPQVVRKAQNPEYHALISEFKNITGIGGILNTSFNLHGEPNVETPEDALRTFELSGLPYLAIGNYLVTKKR